MLNSITIRIDEYEYQNLRNITHNYLKWCYAHFNTQKSMTIEPEPIAALMHQYYFSKEVNLVKFGRNGKALTITYPEAKALYNLLATENSLGIINLRAKIDKELTDWRPSFSKISFKDWYQNDEKTELLRKVYGNFEDLDEVSFEIFQEIFNEKNPQL